MEVASGVALPSSPLEGELSYRLVDADPTAPLSAREALVEVAEGDTMEPVAPVNGSILYGCSIQKTCQGTLPTFHSKFSTVRLGFENQGFRVLMACACATRSHGGVDMTRPQRAPLTSDHCSSSNAHTLLVATPHQKRNATFPRSQRTTSQDSTLSTIFHFASKV